MGILDRPVTLKSLGAASARPAARVPRAVVSFTFDDASANDISVVKPILDTKGVKGGFAIPPDFLTGGMVNGYLRMTWAQVQTLYAAGHEILPHSNDHSHLGTFATPTPMTDAQVIAQVNNKAVFESHGIKTRGFVYPFGEHDAQQRRIVRDYFEFALATTSYEFSGSQSPLYTYAVRRISLRDDTITADHYAQIDAAIANGEWLVFFSHAGNELEAANTGRQRLADVIQYALDHSVPVVTPSQAYDMVRNTIDTGDYPGGVDYFVVDGRGTGYSAKAPRKLGSNADTTVASATNVILTAASNACQIVTGNFTQSFILPTNVKAGHTYLIINRGVGNTSVRSYDNGAYTVAGTILDGNMALVVAAVDSPNIPTDWTTQQLGIFSPAIPSVAYGVAVRDANANLSADRFIPGFATTATAAGTTTLTVNSVELQVFTGSTTQTVALPTTSVVAGTRFMIVNNSTGVVTVQSSGANTIATVSPGNRVTVISVVATPTTAAHWSAVTATNADAVSTPTVGTVALRDAQANLSADAFIPGFATTVTAAGTTTLTVDSPEVQFFTGSSTQTCVLPTTGVVAGQRYTIVNQSTGALAVNASGGASVVSLGAVYAGIFIATQATPTTAAHWQAVSVQSIGASAIGQSPSAFTIPQRNGDSDIRSNAFVATGTLVTSSGGTTTLVTGSTQLQVITGTSAHTMQLPTTGVIQWKPFEFVNESTQSVTINSSGGNLVKTLAAGASCRVFARQATPTTAAHWITT